jgi:hypothetical protein
MERSSAPDWRIVPGTVCWLGRYRGRQAGAICAAAVLLALGGLCAGAGAAELVATEQLQLRWDNTLKYSAGWRVQPRSPDLLGNVNGDDGNRNFAPGLIGSRVDLLSELDLAYRGFGGRASAAGWYDLVYHLASDHDAPATVNPRSVPPGQFAEPTRDLHGRRAEILDAFAFASGHLGSVPANLRVGRHTLLWGESLLVADNGISNAQAPVDVIKALSVPASQAKELFLPVAQLSGQLGPVVGLTVAAFYQLEWRRTRLPAAGSYFGTSDVLDAGGERLLLPGAMAMFRAADLTPRRLGQWGASLRHQATAVDLDLGLHYIQYHDKAPQVYLRPGQGADAAVGKVGEYLLAFHQDIRLLGASFATNLGAMAIAGEGHVRFGTPLASSPQTVPLGEEPDNAAGARYAIGDTLHGQLSAFHVLPPGALWASAALAAEVAFQTRLRFVRNAAAFDPNRRGQAWGVRVLFTPSYLQLLPNLDLSVPMAVTFNPSGKSPIAGFNGGAHRGGAASLAVGAEYRKVWLASLQLSFFFGERAFQPRQDRGFLSLSVQRAF